ncbi:MAG TPA: YqgE/AlgH family protein [Caulobacteraceae bacterium]|nr:YqgE/AlgH family protein [Caulobacteraceae bacterium]
MSDATSYLGGRVLVAMPGIGDPRFERAVIFMCAHDAEHGMGITVNRPVDGLTVAKLLERLGVTCGAEASQDLVLFGGPVERERGFVLHTDDYVGDAASLTVAPGLRLTLTRDILDALAGTRPPPRRAAMALGYAGWGAGQLEEELRQNVWLTCDPDEELLFGDDHEHKWSHALAKIGVSAEHLSAQAGRA